MNTLRSAEETQVNQGRDGPTKTYEDETSQGGLYAVVAAAVDDDDDDDELQYNVNTMLFVPSQVYNYIFLDHMFNVLSYV